MSKTGAKIGEIRKWAAGRFKKIAPGKWTKVVEGKPEPDQKRSLERRWAKSQGVIPASPKTHGATGSHAARAQAIVKRMNEKWGYGQKQLPWKTAKEIPHEDRKILDSIAAWTDGEVAHVRDPSKAGKGSKRLIGAELATGARYEVDANRKTYEHAHAVMSELAKAPAPASQGSVYRGLSLPRDAFEHIKPGSTFDGRDIASFSSERGDAKDFAFRNMKSGHDVPVYLHLEKPKRGTNIGRLSAYQTEEEFVTGGKFKIVSVEKEHTFSGREIYEVRVTQD